jgi:RimJ/RimL family protein N-acetyltransferase
MHGLTARTRAGTITIRTLRNGDTDTVRTIFARLGDRSRRLRFGYARRSLSADDLATLARVDGSHHVLVAYLPPYPVGIAHLVRDEDDRTSAEIAFAVVDAWQGRGIGTELLRRLLVDAACAGITHVHAEIDLENRRSLTVFQRVARVVSRDIAHGDVRLVALTG